MNKKSKLIVESRTIHWKDKNGKPRQTTRTFSEPRKQFTRGEDGEMDVKSEDQIYWEVVGKANQWENNFQQLKKPKKDINIKGCLWREK